MTRIATVGCCAAARFGGLPYFGSDVVAVFLTHSQLKLPETVPLPAPIKTAAKTAAPGTNATIKERVVTAAEQMKADDEISESVLRSHLARELAQRIGKPDSWGYIRKELAEWGLWPIALIEPSKAARSACTQRPYGTCTVHRWCAPPDLPFSL